MNEKKRLIIEATIRLIAKEGIGVATAKIAKEAKVSNGTLFNHFATKQVLIEHTYVYIKQKLSAEILGCIEEQESFHNSLKHMWHRYIHWSLRNSQEYRVLDVLRSSQILSDEVINETGHALQVFILSLKQAIDAKQIVSAPVEFLTSIASGIISSTLAYIEESTPNKKMLQNIIDRSFQIYWQGIQNTGD